MEQNKKEIVKFNAILDHEIFYKEEFGIVSCLIESVKCGTIVDKNIVLKGQMAKPKIGQSYYIVAEEVEDKKYGRQYDIISMCSSVIFETGDKRGQEKFLRTLFTDGQVGAMYEALEDPFDTLLRNDKANLVKVRGCGMKTADRWCSVFHSNYHIGKVLVELDKYNLTNLMVKKLMSKYKSPELVVQKVSENPYILCKEVDGIGWSRADKIALDGGLPFDSPLRVGGFILHYLETSGESGCSWITNDELIGAVLDNLGEEISDQSILQGISSVKEQLWLDAPNQRIGLSRYKVYEDAVADEVVRLLDAENNFQFDGWLDKVAKLENRQGWSYTEEQIKGIETILKNNFVVIQGYAGTGKSTLVSALREVLSNYTYAQCALSGRASSRMTEITGEESYTIHRLLGFPKGDPEHGKFVYHKDCPLDFDIYVIDEISMVDIKLFRRLLTAIRSGSKVICLGDTGQLEAIGCGNLAYDLINSGEVPVVTLTKIHRQAAKSAIITESIKIRNGQQIIPRDWAGQEIRGELRDLYIDCYSDASNTYYKIMKAFSTAMGKPLFNIMETQVIVPIKSRGAACTYELNNSIQELYNPTSEQKEEYYINNGSGGKGYYLRQGDKVINTKNCYQTLSTDGETTPIFNGSLGIVKEFDYDEEGNEVMIIDFVAIGKIVVPYRMWSNIELGYAITVHKFQGSQADHVIFGVDSSAYSLATRELLYTGITRAKGLCELIAQTGVLRMATSREQVSKKQTHLKSSLYESAHPKLIF